MGSTLYRHVFVMVPNMVKNENRIVNSVDPDETAHYEQSHMDLHRLHWYLNRSKGLKGFR